MKAGKPQFVFLLDGKPATVDPMYAPRAQQLVGNDKLTEVQALNLNLNLQLIEMEKIRLEKGLESDEDEILEDNEVF
jgi:hypothetical protein